MTRDRTSLEIGRRSFRDVAAYDPALERCRIDLSDNTNLWGAPPTVRHTIESVDASSLTRYPAPYTRDLVRAFAGYVEVEPDMIIAGCGSDDLLDSAIRAFGEPGSTLGQFDPTFGMIRVFATVNGLSVAAIPRLSENSGEQLLESNADVIYLCSPNNPTGELLDSSIIESIVAQARGVVIVDEAYAEFSGASSVSLLSRYSNLLITRTMSKAFGLAGLRLGFAVGAPSLIREVEKSRGPYMVTSLTERAGIAALENDRAWMVENVQAVKENRERLVVSLTELGLEPLSSFANFVLVPVSDSSEISRKLLLDGVAVRQLENLAGIGDALRITIGPWPMLEECVTALKSALR
jgi:histidinol-phosphate aminotransferase